VLRPAGYGTYACGKWHVNEPGPVERGFDEFYGFVHGYAVNSWEPGMMIRLPKGRPQRSYAAGEYYATTAITDTTDTTTISLTASGSVAEGGGGAAVRVSVEAGAGAEDGVPGVV